MPGLGFLKKKRTRDGHTDHPATSNPPSPVTAAPASSSSQQQQQSGGSSAPQVTPSSGQAPASSGAGHHLLHLDHHHHQQGTPHASSQQQQQQQLHHQQEQPQHQPSHATSSSSAGAGTIPTATTTTSSTTSPTTAATTPATSGNKDPQSLTSANHLEQPPHQHDGASHARPSSNHDASPFTSAASLGAPLAPLPSASPGTDPNSLYNQQQAARPAPPHPDAMQTDQPSQEQQQPQSQPQQASQPPQQHDQSQQNQNQPGQGSQARVTKGKYSLVDFEILRTLGTGSFGRVHLVQSKHNQRFYAIKVLKKAQVVKMKQVEHTNDERRMLSDVKHPFLITLWGTFQDWKNLYMVMDFVEGGELFSLLRKSGRFPNPVAKFYAAEVTLALEYLHSKNIIYRDLKPENLLLDRHGHLKITDFGFAKRVPDKTWTLCGTPDYLAPEVVSNKGYNKSVDWWSLGILIYEMLCGYTPFWDSGSPMRIYENILKGKVKYPAYIVPEAQNLLERLITADLTKRLGNLYGGSSDVKSHPWFAEVTWDRLARKDIDAPYTPPVKAGAGDASQFDKYPEEHDKYGVPGGTDDYGHLFTEF